MSEDFGRKMQVAEVKSKHAAEQDFARMRKWYHALPSEDRKAFKQDLRTLFEITERMSKWGIMVEAAPIHSEENDDMRFWIGSHHQTKVWLDAIELWEETKDPSQLPLA